MSCIEILHPSLDSRHPVTWSIQWLEKPGQPGTCTWGVMEVYMCQAAQIVQITGSTTPRDVVSRGQYGISFQDLAKLLQMGRKLM